MQAKRVDAFRASLFHFLADPLDGAESAYEYFDDGLLVLVDGIVEAAGDAKRLLPTLPPGAAIVDHRGKLIIPGFIDTHVHYPQTDIIAADGEQLLDWLTRYTYPAERRFADPVHAREVADFFLTELLRNGTTTAAVFATVHPQSVDAFFEATRARGARMICGKCMMDRHCPDYLRDTAESSHDESQALIERWHGRDRLLYAVTPRFAPTSTERQLELAGRLLDDNPGVYLQTHVAENRAEVAWVKEVFPWSRSYLDVYDRFGLVRERAVYGHCIYLDDVDRARMASAGAAMSFCPTSNLFLGSGLFDIDAARAHGVRIGLGTDVGGGTSLSMLRTQAGAYEVVQLARGRLAPLSMLYHATLGGARSLYLDGQLGNFESGKEGDFLVIDLAATPLLARRIEHATTLAERLFAWTVVGDDRSIAATYLMGVRQSV
jgi:guanine deaminase